MRGALMILLLAAPVHADQGPHREGEYGGVRPGGGTPGDARAASAPGKPAGPRRPPPKGTLTWIGFAAGEGGVEVFFQSVAPFEVSQRVDGGALLVHLGLTRLGHNTWRPIDTRFFDSRISGIAARAVGASRARKVRPARAAGIDVRIAFKHAGDAREATLGTATEADGMYYAYLTFPEGRGPTGAPGAAHDARAPDGEPAPPAAASDTEP